MQTSFAHKMVESKNQILNIVCKILLLIIKEGSTLENNSSDKLKNEFLSHEFSFPSFNAMRAISYANHYVKP